LEAKRLCRLTKRYRKPQPRLPEPLQRLGNPLSDQALRVCLIASNPPLGGGSTLTNLSRAGYAGNVKILQIQPAQ